jgi:SNF2 family DNA or RNA helicase
VELYPYQLEDVRKLARQKAGLNGSEMGTGKTHTAIALDEQWWHQSNRALRKSGSSARVPPTLVIAPLNTFDSWREKYAMQAPHANVFAIDRKNREAFSKAVLKRNYDVYLCHWDAIRLMPELQKVQFNTIIGDEIHHIANRRAQVTRALKKLRTIHKLGLSGTATGDKPANLWSVLNWLYPTYYSSYWNFVNRYVVFETQPQGFKKMIGVKNTHILLDEMRPWYVRHLKREQCCTDHPKGVMHWLPDKTYDTIWVDLTPTQRRLYKQMKEHMVAWLGETEETPLAASVVVAQLTRLSQMAIATPEITPKWVRQHNKATDEWKDVLVEEVTLHMPSAKIDRVKEIVLDHPDKAFVVYSSSKKGCYLLKEELDKAHVTSEVMSGDTPDAQRKTLVARFRRREFRIFIGVISAGAEGIDGLQEVTDTAIFIDRDWSAYKNRQAEDRLHRGGQKDTVEIIDIMARDTVDLGRRQTVIAKWEWIKAILGDGAQKRVLGQPANREQAEAMVDALGIFRA